ncbi:MAG: DUF4124 domain-containing protein [Gammaproteobacteria bacterium]|nr:DUF4124 domain-containing protein [Gammaproteobacteria bacterium]MDH5801144.1 DUF4124 domain-containing protein [Gammaproteobacteria bacterium]
MKSNTFTAKTATGIVRITAFGITLFLAQAQAAVYKSVDENGNVTYSDMPTSSSSKKIEVPPQTVVPFNPQNLESGTTDNSTQQPVKRTASSHQLQITAPTPDQSLQADQGNITLSASLSPGLGGSQELVFLLDGKEVFKGQATQTTLNNIDRGTHTVQAQLLENGAVVLSSESVTFHLQRPSVLFNNAKGAKTAPKAKAAPRAKMAP